MPTQTQKDVFPKKHKLDPSWPDTKRVKTHFGEVVQQDDDGGPGWTNVDSGRKYVNFGDVLFNHSFGVTEIPDPTPYEEAVEFFQGKELSRPHLISEKAKDHAIEIIKRSLDNGYQLRPF